MIECNMSQCHIALYFGHWARLQSEVTMLHS